MVSILDCLDGVILCWCIIVMLCGLLDNGQVMDVYGLGTWVFRF